MVKVSKVINVVLFSTAKEQLDKFHGDSNNCNVTSFTVECKWGKYSK